MKKQKQEKLFSDELIDEILTKQERTPGVVVFGAITPEQMVSHSRSFSDWGHFGPALRGSLLSSAEEASGAIVAKDGNAILIQG